MITKQSILFGWILSGVVAASAKAGEVKMPSVRDARLELHLFAAEPDIVTPIGITVDQAGRVYVVESHTHFPSKNYAGPKHDRVRRFEDLNKDGKPEKISTFADGLYHAMNLAFASDGRVYLTHRNGVLRFDDKNGDGVSEDRVAILNLDTRGAYPHNGLGGLTFSQDGWLYVGLGENLGEKYTLKGTDGSAHSGGGEGGNVFRCRLDGSQLELVATGFWNPFGLAFYTEDYLLAVDNDSDSRPPNRLLDVVMHGDYGYKFRFGRSGLHPFLAWNGEVPGTLPMMAGTGEAASSILPCDFGRWPKEYRGALLVTSWGDHRLELYRPKHAGASLRAEREILAQGNEWFRPVAMAASPEGAVYFTDWVDRDYSVHRKGRIWKLSTKSGVEAVGPFPNVHFVANNDRRELKKLLGAEAAVDIDQLFDALVSSDPFFRAVAIGELSHPELREAVRLELMNTNDRMRLGALLALRHGQPPDPAPFVEKGLEDSSEEVRTAALIWAGEARLSALRDRLDAALTGGPVSPLLLRVHAATREILSPTKTAGSQASGVITHVIPLSSHSNEEELVARLREPASSGNLQWRLEAVRGLADVISARSAEVLKQTALDVRNPELLRAEALVALAGQARDAWPALLPLLQDRSSVVSVETVRALRSVVSVPKVRAVFEEKLKTMEDQTEHVVLAEQLQFALAASVGKQASTPPRSLEQWRQVLQPDGDADSGRRVFYHPTTSCGKCHRIENHGGYLGPDLSTIARSADKEKLMLSILDPSREIAPQFAAHEIETTEGTGYTGLLIGQDGAGAITLMTVEGKAVIIPGANVASNTPSKISLMPDGLESGFTIQDFRDLLAFLLSLK